jgi:hypothetical protein
MCVVLTDVRWGVDRSSPKGKIVLRGMAKAMIGLVASQDAGGDGWVEVYLPSGKATPFVGFHFERLIACGPRGVCTDVAVFGGSAGAAEDSGLLVTAGHAFVHGVIGSCLSPSCRPIAHGAESKLLTTLSVALPKPAPSTTTVCLENAVLHAGAATSHVASACAPLTLTGGLGPPAATNRSRAAPPKVPWRRTGVALVKTYKTGSSTLGSLLHRYADARGLDVAVNAKALKHARNLEPRLRPGTMPKPTECLYEFHTFKPCGKEWLNAQARASVPMAPKPLQLVIDHSRWQPLTELLPRAPHTANGRAMRTSGGSDPKDAPCAAFVHRMQQAAGAAHTLFAGGHSSAAATELRACVRAIAASQRSAGGRALALSGPDAYREAVPSGLLVTLMRWPPSRFTSAIEQFDIPQQTGVPCARNRRRSGGRCFGQTCERDFRFTWTCLNRTAHRVDMLATVMRCLMGERDRGVHARRRLADLDAMVAAHGQPPTDAHARAYRELRTRLEAEKNARGAPAGCDANLAVGGRRRSVRDIPGSFRFVQESIANTLGWPLEPRPRVDDYARMLHAGGASSFANRLRTSSAALAGGGAPFAALTFEWLGALARSLDVVLIAEHYDESLLLLARRLHVSPLELLYLSQKRRKVSASAAAAASGRTPAANAALAALAVGNATAWPAAAMLADADGPWLWPSELDASLRHNWLDALAYMYYNASLWEQLGSFWPGAAGQAHVRDELARFGATRRNLKLGCARCEARGAAECLRAARAAASEPPPHLCWSMRQDTRSWSEHFFRRMALRFDAAASATAPRPTAGRRRAAKLAARMSGGGDGAGLVTGNVHWWRCEEGRAVAARCARLGSGSGYSLRDCGACSFR